MNRTNQTLNRLGRELRKLDCTLLQEPLPLDIQALLLKLASAEAQRRLLQLHYSRASSQASNSRDWEELLEASA